MKISFKKVTPLPLDGVIDLHTEIWNVDFNLEVNKHTKIYAPSGKGKSTFMHLIYGLRDDYKGHIEINDRPITSFGLNDWAMLRQEKISLMFQDLRLFLD
ncbi:MAG TPA: ATP-binding cassette domain-containing protein, partial [Cytophagales bacterium]|nr:ATP-binding cassette domain-containing protein [Cytophagales bacterium]